MSINGKLIREGLVMNLPAYKRRGYRFYPLLSWTHAPSFAL